MHFMGIPLNAPDPLDIVIAPITICLLGACALLILGSTAYGWSIVGALTGGVTSRVVGIQAKRSSREAVAAGVFGAFGGCAALTAFILMS